MKRTLYRGKKKYIVGKKSKKHVVRESDQVTACRDADGTLVELLIDGDAIISVE